MYETVNATVLTDPLSSGYVLSPSRSAVYPSPAVMAARYVGAAPELLEALIADAQAECDGVLACELEEDFERAKGEIVSSRFGGHNS